MSLINDAGIKMERGNPSFDFLQYSDRYSRKVLEQYDIALTVDEAQNIQQLLDRPPTLAECVLWGIQGSEHCSYKSSKRHLKALPTNGDHVILKAKEDAGILHIATDEQGNRYGLAVSHESHNHPSQVLPKSGAATGVGGNIRDVCCMGAEVIAHADSLRFASLNNRKTHWIYEGVIDGIAGYGNAIGVANITGDAYFDDSFNDNCLVTAVTLGLLPENRLIRSRAPQNSDGYDLILVGQPTDPSGFGGASFSSQGLEDDEDNLSAVQQPNAFLGRVLLKSNYLLFQKLAQNGHIQNVGFKDLGAGGIGCASVELAEAANMGAEVWLERVPLAIDDMDPTVILCAETQERYMWAVPDSLTDMVLDHYNNQMGLPDVSQNARAQVVGKIKSHGDYRVFYHDDKLIDAKASDICHGIEHDREARPYNPPRQSHQTLKCEDPAQMLLQMLAHENGASRDCIFECYDKQVQGRTIIERGEADAGVFALFNDYHSPNTLTKKAVSLSVAANPRYGQISSYWTAINAVVESVLKTACVGSYPQAITDCLCFGDPEQPEQMQQFIEAVEGIRQACDMLDFHNNRPLPVIAGNVSLYNVTENKAVNASPIISCIGSIDDYDKAITPTFKKAGSELLLLNCPLDEMGGSLFSQLKHCPGNNLPQPDAHKIRYVVEALYECISHRLLKSAKTVSLGGPAYALAMMAIGSDLGCSVDIQSDLAHHVKLFSETPAVICEVKAENLNRVKTLLTQYGVEFQHIGQVTARSRIIMGTWELSVSEAKEAWLNGLRQKVR